MKIHYNIESCVLDFDDIIDASTFKNCKWYHRFPFFKDGIASAADWFKRRGQEENCPAGSMQWSSTVRACPGIRDYLRRSITVKMPTDVFIETHSDGSFRWEIPVNLHNAPRDEPPAANHDISWHPRNQYDLEDAKLQHAPSENIFKDKINIKIRLPITLACSKPITLMTAQALYHSDMPFQVMNGVVPLRDIWIDLPINTLLPKINETYFIKAGTPIAYYVILDQNGPVEFIKEARRSETPFLRWGRKTFLRSYV